ncbi:MAG: hypothetical protein FWE34_02905 [Defluviitaleaceae bacterium]|nr:hypothetical protein [Defluviitaleaceae bacterium]
MIKHNLTKFMLLLLIVFALSACGGNGNYNSYAVITEMQEEIDMLRLVAESQSAEIEMLLRVIEEIEFDFEYLQASQIFSEAYVQADVTPIQEEAQVQTTVLEGAWEHQPSGGQESMVDISGYGVVSRISVTFIGERFYAIEYMGHWWDRFMWGNLPNSGTFWSNLNTLMVTGGVPREDAVGVEIVVNIPEQSRWIRISTSGTFSITDDRVELVFDDGRIQVTNFTSTQNTLDILGGRYHRR